MRSPRNDRQRQSRRRGFDDDNFYGNTPPPPSPFVGFGGSTGPEATATVKWFNPDKGFGFVALSDGSGDVFLHANALQAAGHQNVSPGATVRVRVGQGQKGRQVEQVISVDESTAQAQPARTGFAARPPRGPRAPRRPVDLSSAVEMTGVVKWYNPEKGFGFITTPSGGRDVFVHASALEVAGLPPLQEGQAVRMNVVQGAKGPEVGSISLA
ncbi:MAG: cold-shock protein [Acetobacteraceae bacterium]